MGVMSGGAVTVSGNFTTAQLEAVWDALTASHVTASTVGLTMRQMRDAAITGQTADSIMSKLVGMTAGQAVASASGMTISSFDNALFTMTASQTIDIIPATGESDFGEIILNITGGGVGYSYLISADSGTTYIAVMTANGITPNDAINQYNEVLGIGNSTGRYRLTTNATAGTRTITRVITTFK